MFSHYNGEFDSINLPTTASWSHYNLKHNIKGHNPPSTIEGLLISFNNNLTMPNLGSKVKIFQNKEYKVLVRQLDFYPTYKKAEYLMWALYFKYFPYIISFATFKSPPVHNQ